MGEAVDSLKYLSDSTFFPTVNGKEHSLLLPFVLCYFRTPLKQAYIYVLAYFCAIETTNSCKQNKKVLQEVFKSQVITHKKYFFVAIPYLDSNNIFILANFETKIFAPYSQIWSVFGQNAQGNLSVDYSVNYWFLKWFKFAAIVLLNSHIKRQHKCLEFSDLFVSLFG